MDVNKLLQQFRTSVKEEIVSLIKYIYLKENNGLTPNFSNDEEYILFCSDLKVDIKINVDCLDLDDETISIEQLSIYNYVVSLDDELFFRCGEDEFNWSELSTDEIVMIFNTLKKHYDSIT